MQYIKFANILICTLIILSTGNAQVVKVVDVSSGFPLEGVIISSKDNMFVVTTDKNGTADISTLITHSSALTISFFGYQSI